MDESSMNPDFDPTVRSSYGDRVSSSREDSESTVETTPNQSSRLKSEKGTEVETVNRPSSSTQPAVGGSRKTYADANRGKEKFLILVLTLKRWV